MVDSVCPSCQREVGGHTRHILRRKEARRTGDTAAASYAAPASADRGAMGSRQQWLSVRDGLAMMYNGILVMLISALSLILLMFFGMLGALLGGAGILAGAVMIVVGQFRCLATPEESGFKWKIVWSVVLWAIGMVGTIVIAYMNYQAAASGRFMAASAGAPPLLSAALSVLQIGANVLFLLFLADIGNYFGNYKLSKSARGLTIFAIVYALAQLAMGAITGAATQAPGSLQGAAGALGIVALLMLVAAIVLLIWNLRVIKDSRDTLTAKVEKIRFARSVMAER